MTPRRLSSPARRITVALAGLAAAATAAGAPAGFAAADPSAGAAGAPSTAQHLDLGPADLSETRQTTTLQPGVTLTRIDRGTSDPTLFWTDEVAIPSTSTSPDP